MKALVYNGPNDIALLERPRPEIKKSTDAIVRITKTTICGTDLGILAGKNPEVPAGTILGHEGIGVVEEVGENVSQFEKGDKVVVSCISSCGSCDYCKRQLYAHCRDGGWILGHLIDGTQAEYVRIPHADNSLHRIPQSIADDTAVLLSDILPTGHEIGVQYGSVKPGDTVAIVGAGPIGMSVLLTALFYSPATTIMVDLDDNRLATAKKLGATHTINSGSADTVAEVLKIAPEGVDVAIEAVGVPQTWDICQKIVAPGGNIANVGVHGKAVDFELQTLWIKNLTITTGLVNTNTTPMLMKAISSGIIDVAPMITHHFKLAEMEKAYQVFQDAANQQAIKLIVDSSA